MSESDGDDNELERIAQQHATPGVGLESSPQGDDNALPSVPRCPRCNRPTDDIEDMEEAALLEFLRLNALKMLARSLHEGQMTHQELAVLRGLIRDNDSALKRLAPEASENDAALPPDGRTRIPVRRPRPDYGGTEG